MAHRLCSAESHMFFCHIPKTKDKEQKSKIEDIQEELHSCINHPSLVEESRPLYIQDCKHMTTKSVHHPREIFNYNWQW